jgi:hypothetical protein
MNIKVTKACKFANKASGKYVYSRSECTFLLLLSGRKREREKTSSTKRKTLEKFDSSAAANCKIKVFKFITQI